MLRPHPFRQSLLTTTRQLLRGQSPGQLIIQYSDFCNARCPQCELRVTNRFRRSKLSPDSVRRMIDAAARRGVAALSFTGGEPLLHLDEILPLIEHAGRAGIRFIRTGSNGFVFQGAEKPDFTDRMRRLADRLAATPLNTFWISLDSADPEVHETMRGLPGVVRGVERALPIFHERGLFPSANLGVNRNTGGWWDRTADEAARGGESEAVRDFFRSAFERFYEFVMGLGFTITNACYPMSVQESGDTGLDAVYGASSTDHVVRFSTSERVAVYEALRDTIPRFRHKLRIFTPLCSLDALIAYHRGNPCAGYACRGGLEHHFVDAQTGRAYPCGFRGSENLGPYDELPRPGGEDAFCRRCDWECYRDPAEMLGPLLDLASRPAALARRILQQPAHLRTWWRDLRYYQACGFFSGRRPPRPESLARFAPRLSQRPETAPRLEPTTPDA